MKIIPTNSGDLLKWSQNFADQLKANTAKLKLDSKKVADIQTLVSQFKSALEKTKEQNFTKADTTRKNAALFELRKSAGIFCKLYLDLNPEMTAEIRVLLGIKPLPAIRSKSKSPSSKPRLVIYSGINEINAYYRDADTGKRSRPKGVRGIIYKWSFIDEESNIIANTE